MCCWGGAVVQRSRGEQGLLECRGGAVTAAPKILQAGDCEGGALQVVAVGGPPGHGVAREEVGVKLRLVIGRCEAAKAATVEEKAEDN